MPGSIHRHRLAIIAGLGLALLCLPVWLHAAGPSRKAAETDKVVALMRRWLCQQPWVLAEWNEELGYSQKTWQFERWTYQRVMEWRQDGRGDLSVRRTHNTRKVTEAVSKEPFTYSIVNAMGRASVMTMDSLAVVVTPQAAADRRSGDGARDLRVTLRPEFRWPSGGQWDSQLEFWLLVVEPRDDLAKRDPPFPFAKAASVKFPPDVSQDDFNRMFRQQWLAEVYKGDEFWVPGAARIHYLCRTGGTAAEIRDVVARGAAPNVADTEGNPPLIVAVRRDAKPEVLRALVEGGAAINGVDWKGNTALIWAAFDGDREVVQELLRLGADGSVRNNRGSTVESIWPGYRDGQGLDPVMRRMTMQNPPTEP